MPNRSLADLPAHQLEAPLNGVLVEAQKPCHRPITKRGFGLDHLFDRRRKSALNLRLRFNRLVVHRASRSIESTTEFRLSSPAGSEGSCLALPAQQSVPFFRPLSSNIHPPHACCSALSRDSYCSLMSSGLASRAFSIPDLAWSIHDSISEGAKSNCRDHSLTVVFH
jgi:hypothetical protein